MTSPDRLSSCTMRFWRTRLRHSRKRSLNWRGSSPRNWTTSKWRIRRWVSDLYIECVCCLLLLLVLKMLITSETGCFRGIKNRASSVDLCSFILAYTVLVLVLLICLLLLPPVYRFSFSVFFSRCHTFMHLQIVWFMWMLSISLFLLFVSPVSSDTLTEFG